MYLLCKDEMLLQPPFLKLMTEVCIYPLIFCFLKMPKSYCELCANSRGCRQIAAYLPGAQGQIHVTNRGLKKLVRPQAM